ncbi:MAG: T9SS type A sorting domain-containing protein [Sphingobacteriales bacterium]|nr:MAG: T9SS type A sorting domain-containing protein [Sphingobacteriales bacterium]
MALLLILFKMNLSLLVFYLVYKLALRKLTFFNFNRFYLLAAIGISAALPFLEYNMAARSRIRDIQAATGIHPSTLLGHNTATSGISITDLARSFYWAGVIVTGGLFLVQLLSLISCYRNTQKGQLAGKVIRTSKEPVSPFSFLGSIFVNPWDHSPEELQHIMDHESVHVKQWHSIDILAGELKRIFCWFNPAAWLLLRAIRENLEFIADRKVLQNGTDARQYQYTLLATQQSSRSNPLSNNFNISHLKFRITMMNRSKSSDMQVLKYLLAVPAVTGLLLLTGFTQAKERQEPRSIAPTDVFAATNLADLSRQAVQVYNEAADTSRTALNTIPPATPPAPPVPPIPPQPENNFPTEYIDPNRITTINITEEIINGKPIKTATKIEARNIKYLTISDDPDNQEHTLVHSNAVSTSFEKGSHIVYLDGERYNESLTELNPGAIKSMSILSGQHAVDFDPDLNIDDKIIVIETNKKIKKNTKSPAAQPFQVFPNPTTHYWTIKTAQPGAGDRYELLDRNGNKKASGKLEQNTQINAATFPEGIYFLKLRIAGSNYETRLEKQVN